MVDPTGDELAGGDSSGLRRALRALLVVTVLVLLVAGTVTAARTERARTQERISTVVQALSSDRNYGGRPWHPYRAPFSLSVPAGSWREFLTDRSAEEVMEALGSGVDAARLDKPFCVTPDQRYENDSLQSVLGVAAEAYVCDLTRRGRGFGWIEVTVLHPADGPDAAKVRYGIGPDAGTRNIHRLLRRGPDGQGQARSGLPSITDLLGTADGFGPAGAFLTATALSSAGTAAVLAGLRRRNRRQEADGTP